MFSDRSIHNKINKFSYLFHIKNNKLIFGSFILTLAGIITRFIGFFYRIFLSRNIGEEGMGVYQLLAPVMALSFSFSCAGIQTSISKHVAAYEAEGNKKNGRLTLLYGLIISISLSIIVGIFLCKTSSYIATHFLAEKRCRLLICVYAASLPFCAIHSCINGYYFGLKNTLVPSITQFLEQIVRVLSVYMLFFLFKSSPANTKIVYAVSGIVIGEFVSALISITSLKINVSKINMPEINLSKVRSRYHQSPLKKLVALSIPLSINRIVLNILQSIEAAFLPRQLVAYGLTNSQALSIYGVFMGMALPMILFPQAITSSVSILLLPYVSEADATNNQTKITRSVRLSTAFCMVLGFAFMVIFYTLGPFIGMLVFKSKEAGLFIRTLSFMCPFLYLGTVLTSTLNGLGKANLSFIINISSLIIRLTGVFLFVPHYGIKAYLYIMMLSQLIYCILNFLALKKYLFYNNAGYFQILKHQDLHNILV